MLKIYINNEEVIANQNFTIQKHMLNTPSVVLNNVCPKTWCDSKDYTSNFHHPQDYSKCKIIDEYIVPAEPGETISGTSFTITNDSTKLNELTTLYGNTTQANTPTPSTPQPINVVSGRQEVDIVGKNLFDKDNTIYAYINSSGNVVNDNSHSNALSDYISVKQNTNYVFSANTRMNGVNVAFFNSQKQFTSRKMGQSTTYNSFNSGENSYIRVWCNFDASTEMTPSVIESKEVQLEQSETPSTYEEYKGQSYEINLGKNLFDNSSSNFNASWDSGNANQLTLLDNGDIKTTANYSSWRAKAIDIKNILPNTKYTLSIELISSTSTATYKGAIRIPYYNGTSVNYLTFSGSSSAYQFSTTGKQTFTFTTPNDMTNIGLSLSSYGASTEAVFGNIQLEKGSVATSYSPYKTPIELCKIGTYQDRIYKDNGTWYIEKQVGKYTFTGSDSDLANDSSGKLTGLIIDNIKINASATTNAEGYCNYYTAGSLNSARNDTSQYCIYSGTTSTRIFLNNQGMTLANFKTWLSTHNTIVYYVLATPTTTEITDSELISQLNAIELLEGLNNVSVSSGDLPGEITIHYNYTEEQTIDDLLFCGVVKNSGNISLNPRQPHYSTLQVLDFKDFLSSGETLDFVIYQKTILEAIQQVIATIQDYGFVLGNVNILNPNEIIGAYSTKDKTAYDVFNYIADITQSRWTTRLIDENTVAIDFYDPTLMPQGTQIDYTNTYFNDKLIDDMKYSYGTNNYRNKQVMISNQVYSNISQTQSIVANGYQTQFPTEQPIGKINSITSNGIPLTFATFNEKDMGYVADFYYNPGDNYFESDDLRSTGEILIIDYVAIVEGRQVITNASEIERINESTGRKGIIARYETRNDATTSTELQKIGESYIKYKGTPEIILTIQSRKNTWEVGQRVQFNAPIDELDTEYMVRSKKINYIANQQENESQLFYTYELVSSFNSETEINYFDNQRAKSTGNIGEGEYISRNIDIESTAEIIFYETTTTEVVPSGDNELNAILNSPFIS